MCGRYRLTRADRLAEKFDAELAEELHPRYNIAPTQHIPVVRASGSRRVITSMRWGLIPNWAKDASMAQINARSETLLERPAFKENFERRRCLIPADGFYEWKRSARSKQPFHFGMKDHSLFAFAGIWDRWRSTQAQNHASVSGQFGVNDPQNETPECIQEEHEFTSAQGVLF